MSENVFLKNRKNLFPRKSGCFANRDNKFRKNIEFVNSETIYHIWNLPQKREFQFE